MVGVHRRSIKSMIKMLAVIASLLLLGSHPQHIAGEIPPHSERLARGGNGAGAASSPSKFIEVNIPYGIATDGDGYVYVSSVDPDDPFQYQLTKYRPDGTQLHQITTPEGGTMARDPATGEMWMLSDGELFLFDTGPLTPTSQIDLQSLDIDTNDIYDVATGLPFPGIINPQAATYDDLALYRRDDDVTVFIAGYDNGWHFVMRVRKVDEEEPTAKIVVTSGATLAPYDGSPHGIAVSAHGTVLTTLGWAPNSEEGTVDRPVAFGAEFPEDSSGTPRYVLNDQQVFSSRGMAIDSKGNFYIASGLAGGGTACGGASTLIIVPPGFNAVACRDLLATTANPLDVAIGPADTFAYVTDADVDIFSDDAVWRFSFYRLYLPITVHRH